MMKNTHVYNQEKRDVLKPVQLLCKGSYHIGGQKVCIKGSKPIETALWPGGPKVTYDPNGEFQAGQMYVQYARIENPVFPYPVCMIHGGGGTGAIWESTLSGEPGWEFTFLQNGFNVNVSDGVERGRSAWAQFPEINEGPPMFSSYAERWTTYRLGPRYGVPFDDSRFDYTKYDQFIKQQVPRWTTSNVMVQAAYDEYFQSMTDGFIVLAHSQGSLFALEAALKSSENVKGIILIEPSSNLDVEKVDVSCLKDVPMLFLYGDFLMDEYYVEGYRWVGMDAYEYTMRALHQTIQDMGGDSTWIELPNLGIRGNTHALMIEDNSQQIADIIFDWMRKHIR